MKQLFFSFILILIANLWQKSYADPDPNFHIYLCFGQSNMQGVTPLEEQDSIYNDRFRMMATTTCGTERELFNWYTTDRSLAHCYNYLSPMSGFGHKMTSLTKDNIQIGVIVVAVGGTSIQLFDKDDGPQYLNTANDLIKNFAIQYDDNCYKRIIDCGKEAQKKGYIKGILFQQGETDISDIEWISRIKKVYTDILNDLNLSNVSVPLLVGETLYNGTYTSLNDKIAKIPDSIPNSHIVTAEGLEGKGDNIHFSNPSYRNLGERYANEMIKLLPDSTIKNIIDTIAPIYNCNRLSNIQIDITNSECSLVNSDITLSIPKAYDNYNGLIEGILSAPPKYTIGNNTIYWTFTDSAGNSSQCPQNIIVNDLFAPYFDCQKLPDLSFDLNTINCSLDSSEIQLTVPIATDNCETAIVGTLSAPEKYFIGNNTIYWTFTDSAGNSSQCPQNIIVNDLFAPYFDCQKLPDLSFDLNTINCSLDSSEIQLTVPIATDNCETAIVGTLSAPEKYFIGNNTIYWTFTDSAGNSSQCPQNIIVNDLFAPYFDCQKLPDLSFDLNTINCSLDSSEIQLTVPIATDNCETAIVGTLSAPEKYFIGNNMIYWTFTDSAGNTSQCTQTIIVLDKSAPVVNCNYIVPLTYNLFTSDCGINSQLLNIQTPYAIDNCESIVVGHADIPDYFEIGDHTIDWHFTDIYGNESSCSQSVTIADYYAPVVQPDAETILYITLPLNANDISSDEIDLPTLFATDNCDERIEGDVIMPTKFSIGDNSILWTFRDAYGNVSYFPQNIFAIKQFELEIYPNPVHETLYIAGLESDEEITLYNTIGQNIYQTKSTGNPTIIDMTDYTDNLYFIFIRNQYSKIIRK